MRAVMHWVAWLGVLLGLWLAFVGGTSWGEEVAGVVAGAIGATAAEVVRQQGLLRYRLTPSLLLFLPKQLWHVVRAFLLLELVLLRSLATRRIPVGAFRVRAARDTGADDAAGRGLRAFAGWAGSLTPNTVVVDVDRAEGLLLEHHLLPERAAQDPLE
jgi:multisubunit Na+/H+ antiporter MnhE subunit